MSTNLLSPRRLPAIDRRNIGLDLNIAVGHRATITSEFNFTNIDNPFKRHDLTLQNLKT
jgi:hypothetical protein